MPEQKYSLDEDLKEAQAMAAGLESYVQNSELYGRTGGGGMFGGNSMPSLTTGALLMRLRRLGLLRDQMTPTQQAKLDEIKAQHEAVRKEWRTHYENKLLKEAISRLEAMRGYFEEIRETPNLAVSAYKPEALRRTIVQDILAALDEWGIKSANLDSKVRVADSTLRSVGLQPSEFIWSAALEPAYPQRVYWWLYSKPRENR